METWFKIGDVDGEASLLFVYGDYRRGLTTYERPEHYIDKGRFDALGEMVNAKTICGFLKGVEEKELLPFAYNPVGMAAIKPTNAKSLVSAFGRKATPAAMRDAKEAVGTWGIAANEVLDGGICYAPLSGMNEAREDLKTLFSLLAFQMGRCDAETLHLAIEDTAKLFADRFMPPHKPRWEYARDLTYRNYIEYLIGGDESFFPRYWEPFLLALAEGDIDKAAEIVKAEWSMPDAFADAFDKESACRAEAGAIVDDCMNLFLQLIHPLVLSGGYMKPETFANAYDELAQMLLMKTSNVGICPHCGNVYTGGRATKVFCSNSCKVMANNAKHEAEAAREGRSE